MTRFIVRTATVPGTETSIRIERVEPTPVGKMGAYSVVISNEYGDNSSYGRATLAEAKATANGHWSYLVSLRNTIKPFTVGTSVTIKHVHGATYVGTIVSKTAKAIKLGGVTVTRNDGTVSVLTSTVSIPLNGIAK